MSSSSPRIELLCIGDELLNGIRHNGHLHYMGGELIRHGLNLHRSQEVLDHAEEIEEAFRIAWQRSDIVITTGGLGPTEDDRTRETIARVLGQNLIFDSRIEEAIRRFFARMGREPTRNNLRQCYIIDGAEALPNPNGTAPGQWYETEGKRLVMLPGPSHELQPMLTEQVLPRLRPSTGNTPSRFIQLRTCGIGESLLEETILPILKPFEQRIDVAYCAHQGMVDMRLQARDEAEAVRDLQTVAGLCADVLGEDFVGYGECSIAALILKQLRALNKTIAVAESCTGGLIGARMAGVPGASKVFAGGMICYNVSAKVDVLGVPEIIVQQHGEVSHECAVAMATAASERFDADYALSITGFAGPTGGTDDNPVGTVYMGYCSPVGVWGNKRILPGGRQAVQTRAVTVALDWMRRKLKRYEIHDVLDSLTLENAMVRAM